jgi:putative lipoprotein (rSAM/lipoprotein system)
MKGANWILAGLLTLLGFSGCEIGETPVEYGTPYADYTVKGTVVNRADGKPVKGIRVSYTRPNESIAMYGVIPTSYEERLTDTSGDDGSFTLSERLYIFDENPAYVYTHDIDGTANGGYFGIDSLAVDFSKVKPGGKPDGWYDGEYTVTVTVELTDKREL